MAAQASAQLHAIAAALKNAGERDIRLGMVRGLRSGAAPLIPMVKQSARDKLPKRGGLNEQVAGQQITVSVRTGINTAGVRLTTTAPDTKQTNSGFVRHPVFDRGVDRNLLGGKTRWVTQQIPQATGWWTDPLAAGAPIVEPFLLKVMEEVAAKIAVV